MFDSLRQKNFLVTFLILSIAFVISYLIIYNYLPQYYINQQEDEFYQNTSKIVSRFDDYNDINMENIKEISADSIINYYIINDENEMLYFYDASHQKGYYWEGGLSSQTVDIAAENDTLNDTYIINYKGDTYKIVFTSHLNSIEGIREVLNLIIPYMILVGLILSVLTSIYFNRIITYPIIELNRRAVQIANLHFSHQEPINRRDEIGMLSRNLAIMSNHLEKAVISLESEVETVETRDSERKELMAILSHELKTPLTVLIGQTECMIHDIGKYKDHKKYLKENLKEFERLDHLVAQILSVSKIDNFEDNISVEKVNVESMISKRCIEYDELYKEKNLNYHVELDPYWKSVIANKTLVEFVVKNLIENAFKYAKPGSNIEISATAQAIRISNISEFPITKSANELLKPFIQNNDSRNSKGHGLGLYIIEKSVANLNAISSLEIDGDKFTYTIFSNEGN